MVYLIPNQTSTFVCARTLPAALPVGAVAANIPRYTPTVSAQALLPRTTSLTPTNGPL